MKKEKIIQAYKGFDSNLTCRGFQYEVGKEYTHEGKVNACNTGFHACKNPFDVLNYYSNFTEMRYCTVEQSGEIDKEQDKIASSKIKIKAEIGWDGLFNAGIGYLKKNTGPSKIKDGDFNDNGDDCAKNGSSDFYAQIGSSGDYAQIGSSGDYAQIGSSGNYALIGSSGDCAQIGSSGDYAQIGSLGNNAQIGSSGYSAQIGSSGNYAQIGSSGDDAEIKSEGENTVVMCAGNNSMACGKIGSWLTLAEWKVQDGEWRPVCVKTERIDDERIKADTFYKLTNGEFTEVENEQ